MKGKGKQMGSEPPRILHIREDAPTVQLCGDSEVVGKWINRKYFFGTDVPGESWTDSKKFHQ